MADTFSKKERSRIMAAVKSTGNKVTENSLTTILRRDRLTGWRRHPRVFGNPDFAFNGQRLALFVDGCFWHGCPSHLRMPASNRGYWTKKIARNQTRDRIITRSLRLKGWRVVRIWEHELRNETRVLRRIAGAMAQTKRTL